MAKNEPFGLFEQIRKENLNPEQKGMKLCQELLDEKTFLEYLCLNKRAMILFSIYATTPERAAFFEAMKSYWKKFRGIMSISEIQIEKRLILFLEHLLTVMERNWI